MMYTCYNKLLGTCGSFHKTREGSLLHCAWASRELGSVFPVLDHRLMSPVPLDTEARDEETKILSLRPRDLSHHKGRARFLPPCVPISFIVSWDQGYHP